MANKPASLESSIFDFVDNAFLASYIKPIIMTIGAYFATKTCVFIGFSANKGITENVTPMWRTYDLFEKYGEYVVITNAGDDLGAAFASEFARRGHSLILIRSKVDKQFDKVLPYIEKHIKTELGRKLKVIIKDEELGDHLIYEAIENELAKDEYRTKIGIMLNNCGMPAEHQHNFLTVTSKFVLKQIHKDVVDYLLVTKSVIGIMIENRKGLIVNVTTPENFSPFNQCGFPVSSKVFTDAFNDIVRKEISKCPGLDIKVQAIHPGSISRREDEENRMNPTPRRFVRSVFKILGTTDTSSGYAYHSFNQFLWKFVPKFLITGVNSIKSKFSSNDQCSVTHPRHRGQFGKGGATPMYGAVP